MPLRLRRGLEEDRLDITPKEGEPIFTTDTKILYMGDGDTPGGWNLFVVRETSASTSSTSQFVLHEVPILQYTSVKYLVQVACGSDRQVSEVRVLHNESESFITEYGWMSTTGNKLATFDSNIVNGNIRLLATPQQGALTTFQLHSQALKK